MEKQWVCGPIKVNWDNGYIYLFDVLKEASEADLALLMQIFELERHPGMPRGEEEFILVACLQRRWQEETKGEVSAKAEACHTTYRERYQHLLSKLQKGEVLMSKKEVKEKTKKAKTLKEKKEPGMRGRLYEVSDREPKDDSLGPQAKLVYEAIKKVGPAQPQAIADAVKEKLTTKQGPERVVAFYLAQFKKSGYVRTSDPTKAA